MENEEMRYNDEPLEQAFPPAPSDDPAPVVPAAAAGATVNLSVEQLMAMITAASQASADRSAKAFETLATAIQDSRKPYKSKESEENDANMRKAGREQAKRMAENIKASQAACQHLQGSNENSDFTGQLTSIVKHYTDAGVQFGICTNCLRQFWPGQKDYAFQMNRKSGNRTSMAGRRYFVDPRQAALDSMPKAEERAMPEPKEQVYA